MVNSEEGVMHVTRVIPPFTTMTRTVETAQEKVKELSDRNADTTDSNIRYLAYGARLRTALRASTRYIAYVGGLFFVHPHIMQGCRQATSVRPFVQSYLPGL